MNRLAFLAFAIVVSIVPLGGMPAFAATDEITPEQVVQAIDRGVAYLKRRQTDHGTWNDVMLGALLQFEGGTTALCTLALLHSGVPPGDPTVAKALTYLRGVQTRKTYVLALQTMVFCAAEPNRDLLQIERNVRYLESQQITNAQGDNASYNGGWGYDEKSQSADNSNSQFAVLALHEAERAGVQVDGQTWRRAYDYWVRMQKEDGSWGYNLIDRNATGSRTCAGIGALVITSGKITAGDARVVDQRVECCCSQEEESRIENGIRWLGNNFSVQGNPRVRPSSSWLYYYLYGLERVGRLTGRRFLGEHDWYREGADFLVLKAKAPFDEAWTGSGIERRTEIATSMALLFLSKGRRPVVIAKLKHGPGNDWNNHRSDVAHLTAYIEQAWDIDLSWQIYDPAAASVEDLLQAPVLFVSGSRNPELDGQGQKLRDYIDRGGFVFAEACCRDGREFDRGFRRLIERIFPEPEYRLRQIEPEHPIWRAEKMVRPETPYLGKLWAIEYGCRTCLVYSEMDLSCSWELYQFGRRTNYPPAIQQRIEDGLTVGLNVLTYATNREPRYKEQLFARSVDPVTTDNMGRRGVLQIAKMQHGGGCNAAPGALANLVREAGQGELRLRIRAEDTLVTATEENLRQYHLVFMHGRHAFRFTPAERKALRDYLERGGTLLADSICASQPFIDAFRGEMREIFPETMLARVPADDGLFTPEYGGYDIRQVTRRDPKAAAADEPLAARNRRVAPDLEGIRIDDRWAVLFSPYDISCALERHDSLQCRGYTREDALRIGLNVIVYMLNQ